MAFWAEVLKMLEVKMETPVPYGWFHLLCWGIVLVLTAVLCTKFRSCSPDTIRKVIFGVAVAVTLLEIYKQVVYTFEADGSTVTADFQWYAFPWQFCSTPMYVGLLTGVFRKGRVHDALCAFLATYALFAGLCVMFYPTDVFIDLTGINIQTMVCHGSMIVIGVWLLATGYVKLEYRTILKAMPVFAAAAGIAVILNELTWHTGLTGGETFNMFFISPHWPGTLPVYSLVQQVVPYPWCLVIYLIAFSLAAFAVLVLAIGIRTVTLASKRKTLATA